MCFCGQEKHEMPPDLFILSLLICCRCRVGCLICFLFKFLILIIALDMDFVPQWGSTADWFEFCSFFGLHQFTALALSS